MEKLADYLLYIFLIYAFAYALQRGWFAAWGEWTFATAWAVLRTLGRWARWVFGSLENE